MRRNPYSTTKHNNLIVIGYNGYRSFFTAGNVVQFVVHFECTKDTDQTIAEIEKGSNDRIDKIIYIN